MTQERLFEIFTESFDYTLSKFYERKIQNERDWQTQLVSDLEMLFKDEMKSQFLVTLEDDVNRTDSGENILLISKNKFRKRGEEIERYFEPEQIGEIFMLNLSKNFQNLSSSMKNFIFDEKNRTFKVDIRVFDTSLNKYAMIVELKMKNNLKEGQVSKDLIRLEVFKKVCNEEVILLAIGFDPKTKNLFWESTNSKYLYTPQFKTNLILPSEKKSNISFSIDEIKTILYDTTLSIFEYNTIANEATLNQKILSKIRQNLPKNWRINAEIKPPSLTKGGIDLGIFNQNNQAVYLIELKGHYEGMPQNEIKNQLAFSSKYQKDFLRQVDVFKRNLDIDKKLVDAKKDFPLTNGHPSLNPDFFEKIISLYEQSKGMQMVINKGLASTGFAVFIDHSDEYKMINDKSIISEEGFLNNFKFRKEVMEKVIGFDQMPNVEFIYIAMLNDETQTKKIIVNLD